MPTLSLVLVGLALACPLILVPGSGFDSFRLPAVLAAAAALLACAFVRAGRGGDRPPGPAPLRTAGLLLLAAQLASLIVARSWVDAAAPLLTLAAGLAIFSALRSGLLRRERAAVLLPLISATALLVAALGAVQFFTDPHREAVATEGNRNYAGALAAMLLPPALAFTRRGRPWERALAATAAAGLVFLLLASESRGGFLAALTGLTAAGWALGAGKVPLGRTAAAGAFLALLALFAATQGGKQISQSRLETAQFRLEAWKSGLRMLEQRPVLGWGVGGFAAEYPPFRREAEFQISHSDGKDGFKEVEDPHSSWVATAVETGVPGLFALLLVAYVAARLWRYDVRHAVDADSAAALAGLGGGALAYLVAGGFNTLTLHVSHTILFWTFLGLMEVFGETRPWRPASRTREVRAAIPAAAAVVLFFGAAWTFRVGSSERAFTAGMLAADPGAREALLREALDDFPQSWRAHYELGRSLSAAGRFGGAADQARETLKLRPFHVEALNLAAISILRAGGDPEEAERDLRRGIEVAPFYYKSYFNLALLEADRGRAEESRRLWTRSIDCKPDHGPSYYYRGLALLAAGEAGRALEDFRMAKGLRFDVARALAADRPADAKDPRFAELFR